MKYKKGRIKPQRKTPDEFRVQCLRIVPLNLSKGNITPKNLRNMKKWKHGTRWQKRYVLHKSVLRNEQELARTVRKYWGYGDFKICLFSYRLPNKNGRKDQYGKLRKFTWGFVPRARILISEGYNAKTDEDFIYVFSEMQMKKLPFWEETGKGVKENQEDLQGISHGELINKDDFVSL